jgi:pantoate--beta-alanine ligase
VIPRSVKAVAQMVKAGNRDRAGMAQTLRSMIEKEPMVKVDFAAIVDAETLEDDVYGASTLVYTAVFVGGKRLTDNVVVKTRS